MLATLKRLALSILIAFSPAAALAESAALRGAIASYLAGDDERALPALAALARAGEVDAQILLGAIAKRPSSPWLQSLDRPERRALMRAPGGAFGQPWIKVAAEGSDARAKALLDAERPRWTPEAARALLAVGETDRLAIGVLRAADGGVRPGMRAFLREPALSEEIARLFWLPIVSFDALDRDDANAVEALSREPYSSAPLIVGRALSRMGRDPAQAYPKGLLATLQGFFSVILDDPSPAPIAHFLEEAPDRAVRRAIAYCDATCTSDRSRCLRDSIALSGGYNRLWELGSPSPSVISEEDLIQSPRLVADFAAHARNLSGSWPDGLKAALRSRSCVAKALIAP